MRCLVLALILNACAFTTPNATPKLAAAPLPKEVDHGQVCLTVDYHDPDRGVTVLTSNAAGGLLTGTEDGETPRNHGTGVPEQTQIDRAQELQQFLGIRFGFGSSSDCFRAVQVASSNSQLALELLIMVDRHGNALSAVGKMYDTTGSQLVEINHAGDPGMYLDNSLGEAEPSIGELVDNMFKLLGVQVKYKNR